MTQVLQVRGGSRRPRLRLHGSVAGVVSRTPRTGCLRTHRSLREAGGDPEGEAEFPETGGEEKWEEELEKEEQKRCWESKGREEGDELGDRKSGWKETSRRAKSRIRGLEREEDPEKVCVEGRGRRTRRWGGAERGRIRGKKE